MPITWFSLGPCLSPEFSLVWFYRKIWFSLGWSCWNVACARFSCWRPRSQTQYLLAVRPLFITVFFLVYNPLNNNKPLLPGTLDAIQCTLVKLNSKHRGIFSGMCNDYSLVFSLTMLCNVLYVLRSCFSPTVRRTLLMSGEFMADTETRHSTAQLVAAITLRLLLTLNRLCPDSSVLTL